MRNREQANQLIRLLLITVAVLVLASVVLLVALVFAHGADTGASAAVKSERETGPTVEQVAELEESNRAYLSEIDTLTERLTKMEKQVAELETALAEKQNAVNQVQETADDLETKLRTLEGQLTEKEMRIGTMQEEIEAYKSLSDLDIGAQTALINSLIAKLMNAPQRRVESEPDETGVTTTSSKDANVSLYYEDLTTGYVMAYRANQVMYSASLIKAPYVWTLLEQVKAQGGAGLYDLSRMWKYDETTMYRRGSGKIQDMDNGVEMTYLDLVKYALEYSDNIAFGHLRDVFGYTFFYSAASRIGVTSISSSFNNLSAADAGKFMKEIYQFTQAGGSYGTLMKNSLLVANHRVLIPAAVSPKQAAHKYGWDVDAYHDMAIVYDEHPYVVVIMTDLDEGDAEANAFITGVIKTVDKIHTNFYN